MQTIHPSTKITKKMSDYIILIYLIMAVNNSEGVLAALKMSIHYRKQECFLAITVFSKILFTKDFEVF